MRNRRRQQHVTLRFRRREDLKRRLRAGLVRSAALALVVGFGAGLMTGRLTFLSRFIQRHTPQVVVSAPAVLAGLPMPAELPKNHFWLWIPGSGSWLDKRVCRKYISVRAVRLDRVFEANRVVVHLEPRVPLVTWNGSGFDRDGILFPITPGTWKAIPQVSFLPGASRPVLGRWLARLSVESQVWSQITSVRQDSSEALELTLKSGALVIWGPPETEPFARKAQTLARILDDAHKNLGGAARADLRFFEQGRIIVRPKGVRGD